MQRCVNPGFGFVALSTAQRTLQGDDALPMLRKGQRKAIAKGEVLAQNRVINQRFGVAASQGLTTLFSHSHESRLALAQMGPMGPNNCCPFVDTAVARHPHLLEALGFPEAPRMSQRGWFCHDRYSRALRNLP
jgi:hypothetical protein